jgi:septum formation protein
MLRELAGRSHTVATGVAVVGGDGMLREALVTTRVVMGPLSEAAIATYVATGEPLDKAGGYGIQGPAAVFVERIEGSWTNVVGLPVVETLQLLRDAGVAVP